MEHKNRDDGNISTLTDERLERLQSIGFRWAKRRGHARWDEKYVSWCALEGRTRENVWWYLLFDWLIIPFLFYLLLLRLFCTQNELLQYAAKFGNCHVPTKFKENTALGRWVSTQRAEYKKFCNGQKSSLNNENIRWLDSIGFAWFMAF